MRWLWVPLTVLGIVMIVLGAHLDQAAAVFRVASTLCTACIGLG